MEFKKFLTKFGSLDLISESQGDSNIYTLSKLNFQDIPVSGNCMWYPLEKKNKSKRRGVVRLKLAFSAEHDTQVSSQEHRHLLRILLMHEIESQKSEKYCWAGRWSAAAESLILQHTAQRGLTARNVCLAQWVEFSRVHQEHPLSFTVFNKVVLELLRPLESGLFSNDEVKLFWEATRRLIYSCFNCIRKIRKFPVEGNGALQQLSAILGSVEGLKYFRILI